MGTQVSQRVVNRTLKVLHERARRRLIVIKGHKLIQDRLVARLTQVSRHARNEPQRVVIKAAANVRVAFLGEGLVLVIGRPISLLCSRNVQDALARSRGNQMHKAQQVLVRIAEAHAAANATLVVACRAAHVEGHHALVLVPNVDHTVHACIGRAHAVGGKQLVPVGAQLSKSGIYLLVSGIARSHVLGALAVNHALGFPLLVARVLYVAQHKGGCPALAGRQFHIQLVSRNGTPARSNGARAGTSLNSRRRVWAVVGTQERGAVGIKAINRTVHRKEGKVVATLAVLGLVNKHRAVDLNLAR